MMRTCSSAPTGFTAIATTFVTVIVALFLPASTRAAATVASVIAGSQTTFLVKSDASLWAMGRNLAGQLGDGTLWGMGANDASELGYPVSAVPLPHNPVQVVPAADPFSLTLTTSNGVTAFTEDSAATPPPVLVDPAIVVLTSAPTLAGATVSIVANLRPLEDVLALPSSAATGNITGHYEATTGVLTLLSSGGTATLAQWQAALQAVTYANTSATPSSIPRTVTFVVNNGVQNSAVGSKTVQVVGNTPPTDITLSSRLSNPLAGPNAVIGTLSAADVDDTSFTYTLVGGAGSDDNASFNLVGATLRENAPSTSNPRVRSVRIQASDGRGGTFAKAFEIVSNRINSRNVLTVAAGLFETDYVTTDGTLWSVSQLNPGSPRRLARGVTAVVVRGTGSLLFIKQDHTLWTIGASEFGEYYGQPPRQVATDVVAAALGGHAYVALDGPTPEDTFHSLYVKSDASLWGVGRNRKGQLGDGTTTNRELPVQVASGVTTVTTGSTHTLFIKADGSLWACGDNAFGQLGDGTNTDRATPVKIADSVAAVSAGDQHTMYVTTDGSLWACGSNAYGQLGDGTIVDRNMPIKVADSVATVSAGRAHTLFVKKDGTLWAMGLNDQGQLGDGTTTHRSVPIQITSGVRSASAGYAHSLFIKTDETLWGMGSNTQGELGGTNSWQQLTPMLFTPSIVFTAQPPSRSAVAGESVHLVTAVSSGVTWPQPEWQRNGAAIYGSSSTSLTIANIGSGNTGVYSFVPARGGVSSNYAILGLTTSEKILGWATEVASNVYLPTNGRTFDQVLLKSSTVSITADHAEQQVTRLSFIDLTNDIVQVELSGPGTLSLTLSSPTYTYTLASHYNQPDVSYMKGHAGIVIDGATKDTHVSVYSVGRLTAVNQTLFRDDVAYDGMADLAFIAILSRDGYFGGLHTANVSYYAARGLTGVYAPNVTFTGPVYIGDISAADDATPCIRLGSAATIQINGGDLFQANDRPVQVSGFTKLNFVANQTSHGALQPAQPCHAVLKEDDVDVTAEVVVNP